MIIYSGERSRIGLSSSDQELLASVAGSFETLRARPEGQKWALQARALLFDIVVELLPSSEDAAEVMRRVDEGEPFDEALDSMIWDRYPDAKRGAHVYEHASKPGVWRINAEVRGYRPQTPPGFFGGRLLYGFDQTSRKAAEEIAWRWVQEGVLPDGYVDDQPPLTHDHIAHEFVVRVTERF